MLCDGQICSLVKRGANLLGGEKMLLGQVFERFVKESLVSVMVRGLLEKALCPQTLNELFERNAKTQYTRELLFSTVVNLMSLVVCGVHPSVHAAHQASSEEISVSVTSIYNKINGIEPIISAELGVFMELTRLKRKFPATT